MVPHDSKSDLPLGEDIVGIFSVFRKLAMQASPSVSVVSIGLVELLQQRAAGELPPIAESPLQAES